ncbi:MAG: peptide chain release factor 1 [Candidatus Saganbacteria bacterium]|nr:peptide chain release factor 1 [Candidatus Saganbacteria bacterium]
MSFVVKLTKFEDRYKELESLLSHPDTLADREKIQKFSKEFSDLKEIVDKYRQYKAASEDLEDIKDSKDTELKELHKDLSEKMMSLEKEIEVLLLPKDPNDEKNIYMEIRAGTGGEEAALFAGQLFRMYIRYAERHNWKVDMMDSNPTGLGGFKEVIFAVLGKGAYSRLKYESGTHRVQRVPATEASGRIHTSAATVAVLPEVEDVDIKIDEKEIRIDVYRSGGAGGQNVNKVSTAIRITHMPTGIVVQCQDERSQHQNKEKAFRFLKARLYELEEAKRKDGISQMRKIQVGSGDRSEKIRTYNFPQNRITDHRIGLSVFNITEVMDGAIDELIDGLTSADRIAKLEASVK